MQTVMIPDGPSLIPFRGDIDMPRLLAAVPPGYSIKGAFIASSAALIADEWPALERTLEAPPRGGKYLPFSNYPLTDFLRITDAAARRKFPALGTREAHRLISRSTFEIFAQTALGKVTVALVSGPGSLLMKYEEIFNRMVTGPRVTVSKVDATAVDLEYTGYFSTREAIFGVLEGAVLACHFNPTVTVESSGEGHHLAHVRWTTW